MNKDELQIVLDKHLKWLKNKKGGEQANLRGTDLIDADLVDANLRGANLIGANLRGADLIGAKNFDTIEDVIISYTTI